jgi:hypothetical protein
MTFWSRLHGLVGGKNGVPLTSDPLSEVHWVPAGDSPFHVDLLDCQSFSQSMVASTTDPRVAADFGTLRGSSGEEYRGHAPEDSKTCSCDLRYPHKGDTRDGDWPSFLSLSTGDTGYLAPLPIQLYCVCRRRSRLVGLTSSLERKIASCDRLLAGLVCREGIDPSTY